MKLMAVTIVQLSDTHLLAHPQELLRGFSTHQSLQVVLAKVQALNPDLILLTGDLAEAGETGAYQQLCHLFQAMDWNRMPAIYWLPGNHDRPHAMSALLSHPPFLAQKAAQIGGWRLLLLDSTASDHPFGAGHLSTASLDALQGELQAHVDLPTLIALHHHPLPTGIDWLDQIGLENAEIFRARLAQFPQVKLVLFGHVHLALHQQEEGIDYYGCPSTCTQVTPPSPVQEPHWQWPGFRWLKLHANGTHTTGVQRINAMN